MDSSFHPFRPADPGRETRRSLAVGLIGTVLFHLLLAVTIPEDFMAGSLSEDWEWPEDFLDVELAMEEPEPEVDPFYQQTNPEAPENPPDETAAFAARDQQAANPDPPEMLSPDRTPAREGDEIETNQILSGDLSPPVFAPPPMPESADAAEPEEAREPQPELWEQPETQFLPPSLPMERIPLPGEEEITGEDQESVRTLIAEERPEATDAMEEVEGTPEESEDSQPFAVPLPALPQLTETQESPQTTPARPSPQPRPRLPPVPPGPVQRQPAGVSRTGAIQADARFSEFGEYLERLIEAVSQRWHSLTSARSYSESSTRVVLRFELTKEGRVRDVTVMEGTTAMAVGILLTRAAVEDGAPYGLWTADMVDVLGESQTLTFVFHYW